MTPDTGTKELGRWHCEPCKTDYVAVSSEGRVEYKKLGT